MATTTTTTTMTPKTETFDISGKWTLSRTLSDDPEEMMLLQNFGYFLRKAAKLGSMTIIFKHNHSDDPPTLALTVLPPGGFAKESRVRTLNGTKEVENHFIFGKNYLIWDKRKKTDESLDPYFREEEWIGDDLLLEDIFEGNDKFITYGIWGLVETDGKKQLVKRAILKTKDGKRAQVRQVFEYSPLDD